ncbi:preprotein translocase subunit SecA [Roseobacteraceae bacterium S113]
MPETVGLLDFGRPLLATSPYVERPDPEGNAVDLWLERQVGALTARLPFTRWRLGRRAKSILWRNFLMETWTDERLKQHMEALRPHLVSRPNDIDAVDEAFAIVQEASARILGKRHYKVQLMGALALYEGRMIEMATGEGKTLTATPAAIVAALSARPVHVVTVNDYLAARDAEETKPLYDFFGLTIGVIDSDMDPPARREIYACDIAYVSNNNLAFDYLRDRIALAHRRGRSRRKTTEMLAGSLTAPLLLRGLSFCIVDEADSVLVDEARTPLILSSTGDDPDAASMYQTGLKLARALDPNRDYKIDEMNRQIDFLDAGKAHLTDLSRDLVGIWRVTRAREELVRQALSALHLFELGRDYVILEGTVQIVDEFTGRVMPDRSWQGGLHQMIEAKENVDITGRKETLARITYQRFFRRYLTFGGMTGTGMELAGEFRDTFAIATTRIPRHRPRQVRHQGTRFVRGETQKWAVVAEEVARIHRQGRPVLVGTRSVEASEQASRALVDQGIAHEVLNATQDKEEADIIALAGQRGAVTVATNIAGRGTDILPGEGVKEIGGLHVILTEFHESSRIDRQLYGRTGRQGAPGSTRSIVSLEDALFMRFAPRLTRMVQAMPLPVFCHALRLRAQARAEAEHATTRREQTKTDRKMERSLAFTGPTE